MVPGSTNEVYVKKSTESSLSPERSPTDPSGGSGTVPAAAPPPSPPAAPRPSTSDPCLRTVATSSRYPSTSASSPFMAFANWSVCLGCCATRLGQSPIGGGALVRPPAAAPPFAAAAATAARASPTTSLYRGASALVMKTALPSRARVAR